METCAAEGVPLSQSPMAQQLETLVQRVIDREGGAWQALWKAVEPRLYSLTRRPSFLARISQNEDDCRNIVVDVLAALQADDFARLRLFLEARRRNPGLPFFAWLAVVTKRLAIDYMRRQEGYQDLRARTGDGPKGAWRLITALPPASQLPGARPPVTSRGTAAELLTYARGCMPPVQAEAIHHWLLGERFEDIARTLGLGGGREAERLVRAALERLRHHFREDTP
jgi:DNA-directed RNA polymerase specialized sigma24 family protein